MELMEFLRFNTKLFRVIGGGERYAVVRVYHFYDFFFFFSSRRRHTRFKCDWSSDVCSFRSWNRYPKPGPRDLSSIVFDPLDLALDTGSRAACNFSGAISRQASCRCIANSLSFTRGSSMPTRSEEPRVGTGLRCRCRACYTL